MEEKCHTPATFHPKALGNYSQAIQTPSLWTCAPVASGQPLGFPHSPSSTGTSISLNGQPHWELTPSSSLNSKKPGSSQVTTDQSYSCAVPATAQSVPQLQRPRL